MSQRVSGRRRDVRIDRDVLAATLAALDEIGYTRLSIGEVARRANVHRPAIYRRWPSKQHLVVDALATTIGTDPTPDTGALRDDLITGIATIVEALDTTTLGRVLPSLLTDLAADPALRQEFLERVFHARRATTARTLEHAIERGEIRSDIDLDFVLDALAAPIYFRGLFRHLPLDERLVERTVDMVLSDILGP